ncbi:MAG: hypothetical protein R3C18_04590 [Planctomycetaceae bacterium]
MAGQRLLMCVAVISMVVNLAGCSPPIDVENLPSELAEPAVGMEVEGGSTEVPPAIVSRVNVSELQPMSVEVQEVPEATPPEPAQPEPEPPLQQLARVRTELRHDIDVFLQGLDGPLQDKELVEIRALYAVHDLGQFLEELEIWLEVPGRKKLVGPTALQQLQHLHERWNAYLVTKSRVLQQLEEQE